MGHGAIMGAKGQSFIAGAGLYNQPNSHSDTLNGNSNGAAAGDVMDSDGDIIGIINNSLPTRGNTVTGGGEHTNKVASSSSGLPVGSFIDEKIRTIQQSKVENTSSNNVRFEKFDSRKAQQLAKTVYNSRVADVDKHHIPSKYTVPGANSKTAPHHSQNVAHLQMKSEDPILSQIFASDTASRSHKALNRSNSVNMSSSGGGTNSTRPASGTPTGTGKRKQQRPSSANSARRDKKSSGNTSTKDFNQFNPALLF